MGGIYELYLPLCFAAIDLNSTTAVLQNKPEVLIPSASLTEFGKKSEKEGLGPCEDDGRMALTPSREFKRASTILS